MTIKKKKNSSAENKNYNIVNRAVQTDTGANLKTFILKKKKKKHKKILKKRKKKIKKIKSKKKKKNKKKKIKKKKKKKKKKTLKRFLKNGIK